jgi:hypothetical protein
MQSEARGGHGGWTCAAPSVTSTLARCRARRAGAPHTADTADLPIRPLDIRPLDIWPLYICPLDIWPLYICPLDIWPLYICPLDIWPLYICPPDIWPLDLWPLALATRHLATGVGHPYLTGMTLLGFQPHQTWAKMKLTQVARTAITNNGSLRLRQHLHQWWSPPCSPCSDGQVNIFVGYQSLSTSNWYKEKYSQNGRIGYCRIGMSG